MRTAWTLLVGRLQSKLHAACRSGVIVTRSSSASQALARRVALFLRRFGMNIDLNCAAYIDETAILSNLRLSILCASYDSVWHGLCIHSRPAPKLATYLAWFDRVIGLDALATLNLNVCDVHVSALCMRSHNLQVELSRWQHGRPRESARSQRSCQRCRCSMLRATG